MKPKKRAYKLEIVLIEDENMFPEAVTQWWSKADVIRQFRISFKRGNKGNEWLSLSKVKIVGVK